MSAPAREGVFARHDLAVALVAIVLVGAAALAHRAMAAPRSNQLARLGLSVSYPSSWVSQASGDSLPSTTLLSSVEDAALGLEVEVREPPAFDGPLASALAFDRAQARGPLYTAIAKQTRTLGGREWLRTEYAYAAKLTDGDLPRVIHAVEYAAVNASKLYVVTLHGDAEQVAALESDLYGSLTVK